MSREVFGSGECAIFSCPGHRSGGPCRRLREDPRGRRAAKWPQGLPPPRPILDTPDGQRCRRAKHGAARKDRIRAKDKRLEMGVFTEPAHRVRAVGTFVYPEPDIKAPPLMHLPLGAELAVVGGDDKFVQIAIPDRAAMLPRQRRKGHRERPCG